MWFLLAVIIALVVVWLWSRQNDDMKSFFAIAQLGDYTPRKVYHHPIGRELQPHLVLPRYFKYKEKYLVPIESQGKCASCWAHAIAHVLADRVSTYTVGGQQELLSAQELLSCFLPQEFHCGRGGIPEIAYLYPIRYGLAKDAVFPYAQEKSRVIIPCRVRGRPGQIESLTSASLAEKYSDRVFGRPGTIRNLCDPDVKRNLEENIRNMKTEIFLNGPICGTIMVYQDLYDYDAESVYVRKPNARFRGGHAIEIFGWADAGQNTHEKGFEGAYWICKNSWGKRWPRRMADKYGWFYVRMGTNEAGIESRASSCLPVYTRRMNDMRRERYTSREDVAYLSYSSYVHDPERQNFFDHLERRRKQSPT